MASDSIFQARGTLRRAFSRTQPFASVTRDAKRTHDGGRFDHPRFRRRRRQHGSPPSPGSRSGALPAKAQGKALPANRHERLGIACRGTSQQPALGWMRLRGKTPVCRCQSWASGSFWRSRSRQRRLIQPTAPVFSRTWASPVDSPVVPEKTRLAKIGRTLGEEIERGISPALVAVASLVVRLAKAKVDHFRPAAVGAEILQCFEEQDRADIQVLPLGVEPDLFEKVASPVDYAVLERARLPVDEHHVAAQPALASRHSSGGPGSARYSPDHSRVHADKSSRRPGKQPR